MKVEDFVFTPDCPKETLEAAKQWLVDKYPKFGHRTNFHIFNRDAGNSEEYLSQACHASFSNGMPQRDCIATENATYRRWKDAPPPGVEEFLRWFALESVFSRFILNRDDLDHMRRYGFVFSSDVPYPVVQNMNIISRHFYELGDASFRVFKELTEDGYPGEAAYSLACNTNIGNTTRLGWGKDYEDTDQIYGAGSHRAWTLWYTLDNFRKFLAGDFGTSFEAHADPKNSKLFLYRHTASIYGGASYCGNTFQATDCIEQFIKENATARERLKSVRKKSVPIISNPFVRKASKDPVRIPTKVNYEELRNIILPLMKEEGFFNVSA